MKYHGYRTNYHKKLLLIIFLISIIIVSFWIAGKKKSQINNYNEPQIKLYLSGENKCITLSLEEYIVGCVSAEMPASFGDEALKAQAVCARTYALRKLLDEANYPQGADLTDDPNNCQAYIDEKTFYERHPNSKNLFYKVQAAVEETRGIIMAYQDEPIDALYHSTCGGKTESAEQVWGKDLPYLKSVTCHFCKNSGYYQKQLEYTTEEAKESLNIDDDLSVKVLATTDSGRAKTVRVSENNKISGEQLRKQLSLPSVWVEVKQKNNKLVINSRGYGHGMGLCQYGADGMADKGYQYKRILKHYYQNINFLVLSY